MEMEGTVPGNSWPIFGFLQRSKNDLEMLNCGEGALTGRF